MKWNIEEREGVLIVEMRSNKANLHNPGFFEDFHEALDHADKCHPFIPLILTAPGNIFSAGIDFEYSFSLFQRGDPQELENWFQNYSRMMLRLFELPRMTVAALNGHAFAGGMILALCCDFRIASEGAAKFSINEVAVGVPMPSVYTEMIRFRLGEPVANETILSGEVYDVQTALRLGFFKKTIAPDRLMHEACEQARVIQPECYDAYNHSKKMLQYPTLEFIRRHSSALEKETLRQICTPESLQAQSAAFRRLNKSTH